MKRAFVLSFAAAALAGCASTGPVEYTASTGQPVEDNKAVVASDFETTWSSLIRRLSEQYFVINNVEKASRIINVSFSVSDPRDYVDCGSQVIPYSGGGTTERQAVVIAAPQAVWKEAFALAPGAIVKYPGTVVATSKLTGRTNIFVAPAAGGTEISVNTRYIFSRKLVGNLADGRSFTAGEYDITFNTREAGERDFPQEGGRVVTVRCVATGKIEKDILAAANRQ